MYDIPKSNFSFEVALATARVGEIITEIRNSVYVPLEFKYIFRFERAHWVGASLTSA